MMTPKMIRPSTEPMKIPAILPLFAHGLGAGAGSELRDSVGSELDVPDVSDVLAGSADEVTMVMMSCALRIFVDVVVSDRCGDDVGDGDDGGEGGGDDIGSGLGEDGKEVALGVGLTARVATNVLNTNEVDCGMLRAAKGGLDVDIAILQLDTPGKEPEKALAATSAVVIGRYMMDERR
jgi:hypothetical protein